MPQMKPLLWVFLMLTPIAIMLTLMSFIYFFPLNLTETLPQSQNSSNKLKVVSWMW